MGNFAKYFFKSPVAVLLTVCRLTGGSRGFSHGGHSPYQIFWEFAKSSWAYPRKPTKSHFSFKKIWLRHVDVTLSPKMDFRSLSARGLWEGKYSDPRGSPVFP